MVTVACCAAKDGQEHPKCLGPNLGTCKDKVKAGAFALEASISFAYGVQSVHPYIQCNIDQCEATHPWRGRVGG